LVTELSSGTYSKARFSHLARVEDVAVFSLLEVVQKDVIGLADDVGRMIGAERAAYFVVVFHGS
jgi:hypothetical protein